MQADHQVSPEMVCLSPQVGVLDLHQLKHNIARRTLHPLIAHVGVTQIGVAYRTRGHFEGKFLDSRDDLLGVAEMAFAADDFAFALAARAGLSVEVVVAAAQLDSPGYSALALALVASDHVVGVLGPSPFAMGTGYLLLN